MTNLDRAIILLQEIKDQCEEEMIHLHRKIYGNIVLFPGYKVSDAKREHFSFSALHKQSRIKIIVKIQESSTIMYFYGVNNTFVGKWLKADADLNHLVTGTKTVEQLILEKLTNE